MEPGALHPDPGHTDGVSGEGFLGIAESRRVDDTTVQLNRIRPLDRDDFEALRHAVRVAELTLRHQPTELLRQTCATVTDTTRFYAQLAKVRDASVQHAAMRGMNGIVTQIFAWLSATRLFLDHSAHFLSSEFGRSSNEALRFKLATTWAFDHSDAYRITSQLRNVFQHQGMPAISVSAQRDKPGLKESPFSLDFLVDRDELLEAYDGWKPLVRNAIEAMPPSFDLMKLIAAATSQFEFLAAQVRDVTRVRALELLDPLSHLLGGLSESADARLMLMDMPETPDPSTLHYTHTDLNLSTIANLQLMPALSALPIVERRCIGSVTDSCANQASMFLGTPHRDGVALISLCDLHLDEMTRWLGQHIGASQLLHPAIEDYFTRGLLAAGIVVSHPAVADLGALQPSAEPQPYLGPDLSTRGWYVPIDPGLQERSRLGVELLTVWFADGGDTAAYHEQMKGILQAHHDNVEPMITGMAAVAANALVVVSGALGKPVDALLGSLAADLQEGSAT